MQIFFPEKKKNMLFVSAHSFEIDIFAFQTLRRNKVKLCLIQLTREPADATARARLGFDSVSRKYPEVLKTDIRVGDCAEPGCLTSALFLMTSRTRSFRKNASRRSMKKKNKDCGLTGDFLLRAVAVLTQFRDVAKKGRRDEERISTFFARGQKAAAVSCFTFQTGAMPRFFFFLG